MKRTITLLYATALTGCIPLCAQRTANVNLDSETRYQKIDGFGGCGMNGQWADVYTQEQVDRLWGPDGMGYNIMRIRINPDESNWKSYVNAVKWAKAHGAIVFASPWTPPFRFKVGAEQTWGESSNHGHINTDSIDSYARWLERYRQFMEDQGAAIDILSVQNESDYDPEGYEGCLYTVDEMTRMVTALHQHLSPECKVMAPECFGWDSHKYNQELVKSAAMRNSIDIWGNHIYGVNDMTYVDYVRSLTKRPMWMTEYIFDEDKVGTWESACDFQEQIDSCMRAGFSAYVYYNMINHMFGDGKGGGNASELSTFAYVLGHYARYATGMTRIKSSFSDKGKTPVNGSAYVSENGDTLSLFVLNRSSEPVKLKANLPFESRQVYAVLTNATRNRFVQDVSTQYAGTASPEIDLLGNAFYTLQFIRTEAETPEPSEPTVMEAYKKTTEVNPLNPYRFCADPTSVEYEGRLYVYGTNDQQEFDATNGLTSNTYGKIRSLVMMSTEDLVNWTYHGTIDMTTVCGQWLNASWAPSIVSREEADGKTHFYLYFSNSGGGVGVITSTSPLGPWTDPLGKNLISGSTPGLGLCSTPFDPGVVIDNDGTGWLAFGGGNPNAEGTELMPGNARIVRLGKDMISLDSDIMPIPAPYHFEANELNVMGGKLVYSYCTSWRERTNWPSYGGISEAPSACSICYMTTDTPLAPDSWTYKGEYFANPGTFGYPYGNNHSHLQKFSNAYYLLYHTQGLEQQMAINGGYRSIAMNRLPVVERSQRINAVTASPTGVMQLTAKRVDPFILQQAENLCTAAGVSAESYGKTGNTRITIPQSGGWTMVKGVMFGTEGIKKFTANLQGEGTLEIRLNDIEAEPVVTLDFSTPEATEVSVDCPTPITGSHDVYFLFTETRGEVKFDTWQFAGKGSDAITNTEMEDRTPVRYEYYHPNGMRLTEQPATGMYIRKTYYSDGSVKTDKKLSEH